ncbi:MAG: hypothetical protein LVQ63_03705 [Thermoplasmatales archaeon]|nr:hypothetical protein [Thermoplasmatales archaeon]
MNQKGSLSYFKVLNYPQSSVYGTAVTCETSAGDWCAVVKAIGTLQKGDVFVAKSIGGTGSAVMGEPMVNSAKIRERQQLLLMGHLETFPIKEPAIPIYASVLSQMHGVPPQKGRQEPL